MSSTIATDIKPSFTATEPGAGEPPAIRELINSLKLEPHIEGGYFIETDRAADLVPSPFPEKESNTSELAPQRPGELQYFRVSMSPVDVVLSALVRSNRN